MNIIVAPGTAALVVDDVVIQIAIGKYADEQPAPESGAWLDAPRDAAPGYLYDSGTQQFTAPSPPRDIDAEVTAYAISLKVGTVNTLRTDGQTDPATAEALQAIETRYRAYADRMNAKRTLDETLTGEEKSTMRLIVQGFDYFANVDQAAEEILAAGVAADPIETDSRWPNPPTS